MALQGSELNLDFFFFFFPILQSFHGTSRLLKNVYLDVEALAGSFEVRPR